MKYLIYLFCFLLISKNIHAQNAALVKNTMLDAIKLYNSGDYENSESKLDTLASVRDTYPIWYYYKAINLIGLQQNERAQTYLHRYLKLTNYKNPSKAYYQIGKTLHNIGKFESALVNLELALDTSKNTDLDKNTELLIEKSIRKQSYFENLKKHNLDLFLGYGYDSNKINKSPNTLTTNLSAHTANYGFIYAYKALDTFSTSVSPTISVLDSYSLNSEFKAEPTTQSSDAFQVNAQLPLKIIDEDDYNYKYLFSLGGYWLYLPITTSERELTLSVFNTSGSYKHPVFNNSTMQYDLNISLDTSHNLTDNNQDTTGPRYSLTFNFETSLSKENTSNIGLILNYESNNPKGQDAKFDRYQIATYYTFSSWFYTTSKINLEYQNTSYPTISTPEKQSIATIGYDILKQISETQYLGLTFITNQSESTNSANKYNEFAFNLNYLKSFSF